MRSVQEGKVSQILYDCFGDFAGFVLETCSGEHVESDRGLYEPGPKASEDCAHCGALLLRWKEARRGQFFRDAERVKGELEELKRK
jgi:hypothetical protein